jgi:hypothetical protein
MYLCVNSGAKLYAKALDDSNNLSTAVDYFVEKKAMKCLTLQTVCMMTIEIMGI